MSPSACCLIHKTLKYTDPDKGFWWFDARCVVVLPLDTRSGDDPAMLLGLTAQDRLKHRIRLITAHSTRHGQADSPLVQQCAAGVLEGLAGSLTVDFGRSRRERLPVVHQEHPWVVPGLRQKRCQRIALQQACKPGEGDGCPCQATSSNASGRGRGAILGMCGRAVDEPTSQSNNVLLNGCLAQVTSVIGSEVEWGQGRWRLAAIGLKVTTNLRGLPPGWRCHPAALTRPQWSAGSGRQRIGGPNPARGNKSPIYTA